MKASAIQPILLSYLVNIYSTDTPVTVEAENGNGNGQKAGVRQWKIDYLRSITEIDLNGNAYSKEKLPNIDSMFFDSIDILKSLMNKSIFRIIANVYYESKELDSFSQFMEFYKQLSIFFPIIFTKGLPHSRTSIKISIDHEKGIKIIHNNINLGIEEFVKLVSDFIEPTQLLKLQNTFKSWIKSLKQEIAELIENSKSIDKTLKGEINAKSLKIPSSSFSDLLTLEGAKKYIFDLFNYSRLILVFPLIFLQNQQKSEDIMQTFEIPLKDRIFPIYYYFHLGSDSRTYNDIPKYINFDLKEFKEKSDHFIEDFSKFFKSSIRLGSQHGHNEIDLKKRMI